MKKSSNFFFTVPWMMLVFFGVISAEAHQSINPVSFYRAQLFSPDEETFRGNVRAIAQTTDGFLWVGTENGLARFDGERFEYVPLSSSHSIPGEPVNALTADAKGGLWIGTRSGLFYCQDGKCTQRELPPAAHKNILSFGQPSDGTLWIGTQTGILRQSSDDGSIRINSKGLGLSVRSLIADEKGYLWAGAGGNLLRLTPRDLDEDVFYNFRALRLDFIRSVCRRRDGSLWLGSNSGLVRFVQGECTLFTKTNGLPDNTVTSVFEDSRGNLWVGTYGGLCRFANGKFIIETTPEAEPYNQILCFFEDRENNLWIGSKEGLHRLNAQPFTTYTTRHGLAHNNVISVYEDGAEALWIGTWGGGLHRLKGDEITIYSTANTRALHNDLILALHGTRDGVLWFGADYDGGLYQMKSGLFQRYGSEQGLARNAIRALLEDSSGRLFIATANSYLNILENGRFVNYGKEQGVLTNATRCLLQTRDGTIWLGTAAGLSRWINGGFITLTKTNGLPDDSVFSLYEDSEQSLWVGTSRGLARMQNAKLKMPNEATLLSSTSFFSDIILEILEDDLANLWLATRQGVFRVAKSELEKNLADLKYKVSFTQFGKADGMASQVCVGVAKPSACKSKDGRLWFATTKGLAVIDPKLPIPKNEKPPFVVIREVRADKQRMKNGEWRMENENAAGRVSSYSISVPPGRGELEFHYTALSYTVPEKNQFKYKLEGLDSDWIDAGMRREAFYNNVPPGDYTFRVIACNNDDVWNTLGKNIKLTLAPHYWQTWWFQAAVILASLACVGMAVRYVTRKRLQLKLERLEQQHGIEKERTRIAQDMHDDLGARITEIILLNDQADKLAAGASPAQSHAMVSDAARELAANLKAIVWAVDPGSDSLDRVVPYIYDYVVHYLVHSSIRCRLEVPDELPNRIVSSEARHNLFLVVKEAVHNTVKYAGATEVWFKLQCSETTLHISIEDNGRGFSIAEKAAAGNGLHNMKKRMEKAGGEFTLQSSCGLGTKIQLKLPWKV